MNDPAELRTFASHTKANDVLVGVASFRESVIKACAGKLSADTRLDSVLPHIRALAALPMHHRDPFDYMLIARAITEDAAIVSQDEQATRYNLQVIAYPAAA